MLALMDACGPKENKLITSLKKAADKGEIRQLWLSGYVCIYIYICKKVFLLNDFCFAVIPTNEFILLKGFCFTVIPANEFVFVKSNVIMLVLLKAPEHFDKRHNGLRCHAVNESFYSQLSPKLWKPVAKLLRS